MINKKQLYYNELSEVTFSKKEMLTNIMKDLEEVFDQSGEIPSIDKIIISYKEQYDLEENEITGLVGAALLKAVMLMDQE